MQYSISTFIHTDRKLQLVIFTDSRMFEYLDDILWACKNNLLKLVFCSEQRKKIYKYTKTFALESFRGVKISITKTFHSPIFSIKSHWKPNKGGGGGRRGEGVERSCCHSEREAAAFRQTRKILDCCTQNAFDMKVHCPLP